MITDYSRQGLYYLSIDGSIVYIGKTTNIDRRIKAHIAEDVKVFDGVSFYPIPNTSDMGILELLYIDKYKPIYNKKDNNKTTSTFKNENITLDNFEKFSIDIIKYRKDITISILTFKIVCISKYAERLYSRKYNTWYIVYDSRFGRFIAPIKKRFLNLFYRLIFN